MIQTYSDPNIYLSNVVECDDIGMLEYIYTWNGGSNIVPINDCHLFL